MAKASQFEADAFVGTKPDMAPSQANLTLSEDIRGSNLSLSKRSMVFDEDRFEDRFLKCSVCKDRFSYGSLPRMLPCHHSFCQVCITHLYELAKEPHNAFPASIRTLPHSAPVGSVYIGCPVCKSNFIVTEQSIKKLPTDHRIVQLMDFVHHTDHYTVTLCSKHNLQPLNFFCELCIRPVCRDCTVLDHKETDGHIVMDLEDAMAKYTPILDISIIEMEAESMCLEEKIVALESVINNIEKVKVDLLSQVRLCMSKLRDLLTEREKSLIARVHQETGMERGKLVEKSQHLNDRRKALMEKANKLRKAKENSLVEEMFRIHKEIRECRAEPRMRVREVDDGLMTTFLLNTRDEAMMASRINNFCDITSKVETTSSRIKPKGKTSLYRSASFR
uniref:RING-type domain-containing protein n=1 Tax=Arion vulgaris TaxID=1028688 RepID=A0A0B7BA48_9EUPU